MKRWWRLPRGGRGNGEEWRVVEGLSWFVEETERRAKVVGFSGGEWRSVKTVRERNCEG